MSDDIVQAELLADRLSVNKMIMRLQQENAQLKAKLAQRDELLRRCRPEVEWIRHNATSPMDDSVSYLLKSIDAALNEVGQ